MDEIAKAYLSQIQEAARYEATRSGLEDESQRKRVYGTAKTDPKIFDIENGLSVHKGEDAKRGEVYYAALNHKTGEGHYTSTIGKFNSDIENGINFPHLVQNGVGKTKEFPSSEVTKIMFSEIDKQNLPMRSDKAQTVGAHKLWGRFGNEALDNGYHVYYHSPEEGLVKLTKETFPEYHVKYHGGENMTDAKYNKRHILVSKNPL